MSIGASFIVASASIKTDGDDELKQVRPGAMPYVLMLPAYWRNQPETNVYCANKYRGLEAKDVNKVTAEAAYERARIYFDYYIEPATTVEELTRSLTKTSNPTKKRKSSSEPVWDETEIKAIFADLKTYKAGLNAEPQSKEKIASEAALKRILLDVSTDVMDWQPAVATRCWRRRLGVFVGVPVLSQPFTRSVVEEQDQVVEVETGMGEDDMPTTTPMNVTTELTRTVETRPFVAIGGAYSPNRFMALLAGVTIQNPGPSEPGHLSRFGFMVGVSFQRDVMGSVFGYE